MVLARFQRGDTQETHRLRGPSQGESSGRATCVTRGMPDEIAGELANPHRRGPFEAFGRRGNFRQPFAEASEIGRTRSAFEKARRVTGMCCDWEASGGRTRDVRWGSCRTGSPLSRQPRRCECNRRVGTARSLYISSGITTQVPVWCAAGSSGWLVDRDKYFPFARRPAATTARRKVVTTGLAASDRGTIAQRFRLLVRRTVPGASGTQRAANGCSRGRAAPLLPGLQMLSPASAPRSGCPSGRDYVPCRPRRGKQGSFWARTENRDAGGGTETWVVTRSAEAVFAVGDRGDEDRTS